VPYIERFDELGDLTVSESMPALGSSEALQRERIGSSAPPESMRSYPQKDIIEWRKKKIHQCRR
jgi:hypothetical protein